MNRNLLPLVLIIVAVGIFFTYTMGQYDIKKSKDVEYSLLQKVDSDSKVLLKKRDEVTNAYNAISADDRDRLKKLLPDHIDNIRLIIDLNGITSRRGVSIKGVRTGSSDSQQNTAATKAATAGAGSLQSQAPTGAAKYDSMPLSFSVTTTYDNFLNILRDLALSLRILDVTKLSVSAGEGDTYDFSVELKTYWLRQN